uniref:Uncharacterized protein n=1 Tax=viral metagenome TaxID=1070528 RepID=A0A6C0L416_9ZZZZ
MNKYDGRKWVVHYPFSRMDSISLMLIRHLHITEIRKLILSFLANTEVERDINMKECIDFHCSLRLDPNERWKQVRQWLTIRPDHQVGNPSMPITFPLPFDGWLWEKYVLIMKRIMLMRNGFLRKGTMNVDGWKIIQSLPFREKIEFLNTGLSSFIYEEIVYNVYREFVLCECDESLEGEDILLVPYLLKEEDGSMSVVNY